jgi:creatinine amidohydrolase
MSPLYLEEMNWNAVQGLAPERLVAILPIGAVEAHGPHLPLVTDGIISGAMARAGARRLQQGGWQALLLPAVDYTAAPFAASFPGTISLRPETETALILDIVRSFLAHRPVRCLALANSHLDPTHLGAVEAAVKTLREEGLPVAFPNLTRKPWALRLTDEFKSGACHAGQYESSIILAERPELVDREQAWHLPPNPASLSDAIREGLGSFQEAGGPRAYFGDPAAATAEEGRRTVETLGEILEEAVLEVLGGA